MRKPRTKPCICNILGKKTVVPFNCKSMSSFAMLSQLLETPNGSSILRIAFVPFNGKSLNSLDMLLWLWEIQKQRLVNAIS
jgi:hypothetical protein